MAQMHDAGILLDFPFLMYEGDINKDGRGASRQRLFHFQHSLWGFMFAQQYLDLSYGSYINL